MPPKSDPKIDGEWALIVVVDCILLASNTLQFSHGFCRGLSQSPAPQRCEVGSSPNFRAAKVWCLAEGPHDTHGGMENHYILEKNGPP